MKPVRSSNLKEKLCTEKRDISPAVIRTDIEPSQIIRGRFVDRFSKISYLTQSSY